MSRLISARVLAALITGTVLAAPPAQAQTTWYVDDDAPNDPGHGDPGVSDPLEDGSTDHPFDAIQEGIDAAVGGDTVQVADGVYFGVGNIDLDFGGKAITVRSANGAATCIIDCESAGRGFYFHSGETASSSVEGFTITHGHAVDGGAVHCQASSPTIRKCVITGNATFGSGGDGGGIFCANASPVISNCEISNNQSEGRYGGGVAAWDSSVTVTSCIIAGNTAYEHGGGVYLFNDTSTISNCLIAENGAESYGGGLYVTYQGTSVLRNSILRGNLAEHGLDITVMGNNAPTLDVAYCNVLGGQSGVYAPGDAILIWGAGNIDVDPGLVRLGTHLRADSPCRNAGDPTGDYTGQTDVDGEPRVADGQVDMGVDEFSDVDGDGLPDWWEQLHWASPTAGDPTGDEDGDGRVNLEEYNQSYDPFLPAITYYVDPDGDDGWDGLAPAWDGEHGPKATIQAAIDETQVGEGDQVVVADGVYVGAGNKNLDFGGKVITVRSANGPATCIIDCEGDGRGFYFHSSETAASVLTGLTIRNGHATGAIEEGGGIHCAQSSPTIMDCIFTGNTSDDEGAGLYSFEGGPMILNCVFTGNTAGLPGGGGMFLRLSTALVANCLFMGNNTDDYGGAIGVVAGAPLITNCTFAGNVAGNWGGACYCSGGNLMITNSVLWGNSAPEGPEVYLRNDAALTMAYNDVAGGQSGVYVAGGTLTWGDGNIEADPNFAFAADAHLMVGSPCVDAGTNSPPGGPITTDADGNDRPLDGDGDLVAVADMGAYEYNPDAPSIALTPATLAFSAMEGGADPSDQTLSIRNCGGGTLFWQAVEACDWLEVTPASGESTGEIDEAAVHINISGLPYGDYACTLLVDDEQAANGPRAVQVALRISDELDVPAEYPTIQVAIDASADGDHVVVADGVYAGAGNKNLDFGGKIITVRSANGPHVCIIDCEHDGRGFYLHSGETNDAVIDGFTIRNGYLSSPSDDGAGINCYNSRPTITDCIVTDNTVHETDGSGSANGGGIAWGSDAPVISGCLIVNNVAINGSGGGMAGGGNARIVNCVIAKNRTNGSGGGIYDWSDGGGGPAYVNCTIVDNAAASAGGAVYFNDGNPTMTNCVVWGNDAQDGAELSLNSDNTLTLTVAYCDVRGGQDAVIVPAAAQLIWGDGNIDADPEFALAEDFRLMAGSPCVDAGSNDPPGGLPPTDADGNTRPLDGDGDMSAQADIGAFEFTPDTPAIAVSPATLKFAGPGGGSSPAGQVLSVRNCGGGTLAWEVVEECDWLSVTPGTGDSTGEIDDVLVEVDTSGLDYSAYEYTLSVRDPLAVNEPRYVSVVLIVFHELHVPSAYPTIQEAIDAAAEGDHVIVADGVYTDSGNKDLDFAGKLITVRSANGPASCLIDCEDSGRGFYFHRQETSAAVVDGFTIRNGYVPSDDGGGLRLHESGPTIVNCIITDCATDPSYSGGAVYCDIGSPTFVDCTFARNTARFGGALYFLDDDLASLVNCVIADNTALEKGGAAVCYWGLHRFVNCTIMSNSADEEGGGLNCNSVNLRTMNCIWWGNSAPAGPQIFVGGEGARLTVSYSDIQGGDVDILVGYGAELVWDDGNINADPLFADPETYDFRLSPGSPCIDAGDNTVVPDNLTTDLDGLPRFVDDPGTDDTGNGTPPIVDIGAYEFQDATPMLGDMNCDYIVNAYDIDPFICALSPGCDYEGQYPDCDRMLADINGDGIANSYDIDGFIALVGGG